MATFSAKGSNNSNYTTRLTVTESAVNNTNNSSTISWKLEMITSGGYYFTNWTVTSNVVIDGKTVFSESKQRDTIKNGTVTIGSGTTTVYHNDDGKKTISCSASTSTSSSQSYLPGKASVSGSLKLTDIARASQFDVSNWNNDPRPVENAISFKIIEGNPNYYTQLVVRLMQEPDSYLVKRKGIQGGTYNFQFTQNELNTIVYPKIPANSRVITFRLETYSDSNYTKLIGESNAGPWYTATIVNANPVFSNFNYEDSGGVTNTNGILTYDLTGDRNKIIVGYSKLKITIPVEDKAIPQKAATISGYNVGNYSVPYSSTSDVVKEIPNYPNESIVVSAVDSRGNSKSITKLFTDNLINYTDIVILNCEVSREDEIGEKVKIKFDGTWWPSNFGGANGGGILNELTAIYQYQTGNGEFINGTTPLTLNVSEFGKFSCEQYIVGDTGNGFNISNSYKIKIIVSDKLSSKPNTKDLIAGSPAIAIFDNKIALHNKYDESREDIPVQIYGDTDVQGNFTVNGSPIQSSVDWGDITGKPTFATVATSGSYNDLSNKPSIPSKMTVTRLRSSTSYNTSNATLTNAMNYDFLLLLGKASSSNSGYNTALVPTSMFSSSDLKILINDEAAYVAGTFKKSGNNVLFRHSGRTNTGYIQYIYGITI